MLKNFLRGCEILARVETDPYCLDADHDVIWVGSVEAAQRLTEEDHAELDRLGWHFDDDVDRWSFGT